MSEAGLAGSPTHENVATANAAGVDAHQRLAAFRHRRVDVAHLEPVCIAMMRNNHRLHIKPRFSRVCFASALRDDIATDEITNSNQTR
jgi:hypothetical protein